MYVLIDFDNLNRDFRRKGIEHIANHLLRKFDPSYLAPHTRATVRLYGGWYENRKLTRLAQELIADLHTVSPINFKYPYFDSYKTLLVKVEMAYSLAVAPNKHLFATFRSRPAIVSIRSKRTSELNCPEEDCPMSVVEKFIRTGRCEKCGKQMGHFLYKDEQKLVDNMLNNDLLYFASRGEEHVALVSSDDDFWPGIITLLLQGKTVTHLKTHGFACSLGLP